MPAPRLLPDNDVLERLRDQGWTYDDIARQYGVSTSAVYLRLRQANAVTPRPNHKDVMPWRVKTAHTYSFPAQMLRLLGRREKNLPNKPVKDRMLSKWLRGMEEAGVVLCYNPDYPPNPACESGGFYYSRRRPSDGNSIIRTDDMVTTK